MALRKQGSKFPAYHTKSIWCELNLLCQSVDVMFMRNEWCPVVKTFHDYKILLAGKKNHINPRAIVLKMARKVFIILRQSSYPFMCTVRPLYNEVLGTMKITLLYQGKKKNQRNIKSWDQQNDLILRGFCYIRPLYNEVPLYYND